MEHFLPDQFIWEPKLLNLKGFGEIHWDSRVLEKPGFFYIDAITVIILKNHPPLIQFNALPEILCED